MSPDASISTSLGLERSDELHSQIIEELSHDRTYADSLAVAVANDWMSRRQPTTPALRAERVGEL